VSPWRASTPGMVACSTSHALGSSGAAHQIKAIDVPKPRKRYVSATIGATADGEIRAFAFTYGLRKPAGSWAPTNVNSTLGGLDYSAANGAIKRVVSPSST